MSRSLVRRFVLAGLLAAAALGTRVALASAPSLDTLTAGALVPSAMPALLGPITEAGRTGWACHPEKAAAASSWHGAELPSHPSAR